MNMKLHSDITGKYLHDYRIKDNKFDLVLCSPLQRTKSTCTTICDNIEY